MTEIIKNIEPKELGRRLRSARMSSGLTQDEAARKTKLARTTLLAIEKGERAIRVSELRILAKIYDEPLNRLLQHKFIDLDLVGRFRRQPATKSKASDGQTSLKLMAKLATTAAEIEHSIGAQLRTNYPPEFSIRGGRVSELAEDAALAVRQHLGIGISPIQDVISILETELGVRVFLFPLPHSVSGVFAFDPNVGACVLINSSHPKTRRNMTACHELGHLVGSRDVIDLNEGNHIEDSREERFATRFAAAFLMPAAWVRRRFGETVDQDGKFSARHLVLLARAAHVSPEAMCRRLEGLGMLKGGTWESLVDRGFTSKFARSLQTGKDEDRPAETPPRLAWLAAAAVEKGLLSEGQLVERLGIDRFRVRELLDEMLAAGEDGFEHLSP